MSKRRIKHSQSLYGIEETITNLLEKEVASVNVIVLFVSASDRSKQEANANRGTKSFAAVGKSVIIVGLFSSIFSFIEVSRHRVEDLDNRSEDSQRSSISSLTRTSFRPTLMKNRLQTISRGKGHCFLLEHQFLHRFEYFSQNWNKEAPLIC